MARTKHSEENPVLTGRAAGRGDVDGMSGIEAHAVAPEGKATRESFEARRKGLPGCLMLLCEDGRPVGLIDGMVTNDATLSDPMFETASLHDPKGAWQSIFGFSVLPAIRGRGAAHLQSIDGLREGFRRRQPQEHRLPGQPGLIQNHQLFRLRVQRHSVLVHDIVLVHLSTLLTV